jgi:hypothetical protein
MVHYSIKGDGQERVLLVNKNSSHRFRFWHKGGAEQVLFQQGEGGLVALTVGKVLVYKLPNANEFHREYMAANRTALWLGLQVDTKRLVENMLEYEETI